MNQHLPTTLTVSIPNAITGQTLSGIWTPNEAEREAAWELCVEIATRVPFIPLRENEGLLTEALGSMATVFKETRTILRSRGFALAEHRRGELSFAVLAGHLLNQILRPVTGYWHPQLEEWMGKPHPDKGKLGHEQAWPDYQRLRDLLVQLREPLAEYVKLFAQASGAAEFVRIQSDNETRLYNSLRRARAQGGAGTS